jgi:hypothetical protein
LEQTVISPWSAQAFNQLPNAKNQIHGDSLAKQYGFTGGLVPGVTISAYLIHPAVKAWGLDWLTRGAAHVRVSSPLYDQENFDVCITESSSSSYLAQLERAGGVVSATADVSLPEAIKTPPARRGDPIAEPGYVGSAASVERWAMLKRDGCHAFRYLWPGEHAMRTYLRDESQMPELLQPEAGGYANMSFILVCSNFVLESNASMNPWVHLETDSQNYRPIPFGTNVMAEMKVDACFEKKGHEFVDVDVELFDEQDDACQTTIKLRAIYKLRGAE